MFVIRLSPVIDVGGGYFVRTKHADKQKNDLDYSVPICEEKITPKVKTWNTFTGVQKYADNLPNLIAEPIHLGAVDQLGAYRNRFDIHVIDVSSGIPVYMVESNLLDYQRIDYN